MSNESYNLGKQVLQFKIKGGGGGMVTFINRKATR